jgi:hypothetical protein
MSENDPFFKGYPFKKYLAGRYYKYVIGISDDLQEAKKNHQDIKKKFSDSFLVKIENEEFSRIR